MAEDVQLTRSMKGKRLKACPDVLISALSIPCHMPLYPSRFLCVCIVLWAYLRVMIDEQGPLIGLGLFSKTVAAGF